MAVNHTSLKTTDRQTVLSAYVEIDYADINSLGAVATDTIELCTIPRNAIVTSVTLEVSTAFVHATSTDLTMAISAATAGTAFIAATDLDSAATTAVSTIVPVEYTATDTLIATLAGTTINLVSAGKAIVIIEYIQKLRGNEVQE